MLFIAELLALRRLAAAVMPFVCSAFAAAHAFTIDCPVVMTRFRKRGRSNERRNRHCHCQLRSQLLVFVHFVLLGPTSTSASVRNRYASARLHCAPCVSF